MVCQQFCGIKSLINDTEWPEFGRCRRNLWKLVSDKKPACFSWSVTTQLLHVNTCLWKESLRGSSRQLRKIARLSFLSFFSFLSLLNGFDWENMIFDWLSKTILIFAKLFLLFCFVDEKKALLFGGTTFSIWGQNLLLSLSTRRQISFAPHYIIWCFVSPLLQRIKWRISSVKIFFFSEMQFLFCQVQLNWQFFFWECVRIMDFFCLFLFCQFSRLCISCREKRKFLIM